MRPARASGILSSMRSSFRHTVAPAALVAAVAWMVVVPAAAREAALTRERFESLHKLIKPSAREQKWTSIPWMTSLWAARERAAAAGKPILLWEMDGHPLGCV